MPKSKTKSQKGGLPRDPVVVSGILTDALEENIDKIADRTATAPGPAKAMEATVEAFKAGIEKLFSGPEEMTGGSAYSVLHNALGPVNMVGTTYGGPTNQQIWDALQTRALEFNNPLGSIFPNDATITQIGSGSRSGKRRSRSDELLERDNIVYSRNVSKALK